MKKWQLDKLFSVISGFLFYALIIYVSYKVGTWITHKMAVSRWGFSETVEICFLSGIINISIFNIFQLFKIKRYIGDFENYYLLLFIIGFIAPILSIHDSSVLIIVYILSFIFSYHFLNISIKKGYEYLEKYESYLDVLSEAYRSTNDEFTDIEKKLLIRIVNKCDMIDFERKKKNIFQRVYINMFPFYIKPIKQAEHKKNYHSSITGDFIFWEFAYENVDFVYDFFCKDEECWKIESKKTHPYLFLNNDYEYIGPYIMPVPKLNYEKVHVYARKDLIKIYQKKIELYYKTLNDIYVKKGEFDILNDLNDETNKDVIKDIRRLENIIEKISSTRDDVASD